MLRSEVIARVEAMLDAWNKRDVERFVGFFAEDGYWHDLGMPHPPAVGRASLLAFSESVLRAFPDFALTVRAPICVAENGQSCVVPWTITATSTGYLDPPGFAPTGRRVRFDGMDYMQFRGDLIARVETRFDPAEPIGQMLGFELRPPAGSLRERMAVLAQRAVAWWQRAFSHRSPPE